METEWDVIQARMGNRPAIAPKEPGQLETYRDEAEVQEEKLFKKWENAVLEKFDELEELDDEDILKAFREKRIAELKMKAARAKFGELYEISEPEYMAEVTDLKNTFVVVFLFKVGIPKCDILESKLRSIVGKYKSTKFVKIRSESAIRGYPDSNLPTLLVYWNGDIIGQVVGLEPLGGESVSIQDVEWALHKMKAIEDCELEEDPRAEKQQNNTKIRLNYKMQRRKDVDDLSFSDDEDDWGKL